MIKLATGFTEGYKYGEAYVESLKRYCNVPFTVFSTGWHCNDRIYAEPPYDIPGGMLQAGHFLDYWSVAPSDVIIFTDADAILQRPFYSDELGLFDNIADGEFGLAQNQYEGATLEDEMYLLAPRSEVAVRSAFPKIETIPVFNCGFIVARAKTYRGLYRRFSALWPLCAAVFDHHRACIQFLICFIVGLDYKRVFIPPTLHAHGHFGGPKGLIVNDGVACLGNKVVAFAHKL